MSSKALNQLYGNAASGTKLNSFITSALVQYAISLYNRASSITDQFSALYSRELFISTFIATFSNQQDAILYRREDDNFFLLDMEVIWALCDLRAKDINSISKEAINALLDIGMNLVANRANKKNSEPYLIIRTSGQDPKAWGICTNKLDGDIEVWELAEGDSEFLKYVSGSQ